MRDAQNVKRYLFQEATAFNCRKALRIGVHLPLPLEYLFASFVGVSVVVIDCCWQWSLYGCTFDSSLGVAAM
eukprot:616106-Amphidinium_carterae.1